jgi:hypothetical protein
VRSTATKEKILLLIRELGKRAHGPGKIYLVGGSSIVLLEAGRDSTIDVDLKLDPEPAGIFEAIADLKNELDLNIELAAPDQFIPALPGWQERSQLIETVGQVEFLHYDFYGQALAKLDRGHDRDQADVNSMMERELVEPKELLRLFESIYAKLIRFPAINPDRFRQIVETACAQ